MSFATRHRDDPMPVLEPLSGLVVRQELDPHVMAALQERDVAPMRARFADGHRAYVAFVFGVPAAWGWVATRSGAAAWARLERAVSDKASEQALPKRVESELMLGLRKA